MKILKVLMPRVMILKLIETKVDQAIASSKVRMPVNKTNMNEIPLRVKTMN